MTEPEIGEIWFHELDEQHRLFLTKETAPVRWGLYDWIYVTICLETGIKDKVLYRNKDAYNETVWKKVA